MAITSFTFATFLVAMLVTVPVLSHTLNSDGLALLALKSAITADPEKSLKSWSTSSTRNPCRRWVGVSCTNDRVTELNLTGLGLTGYIPSELGLIDSLQKLVLSNNNLSNIIPAHLFKAESLSHIDLSHNSLSGPVPTQIKSLKFLTHLDLSSNRLNGSLPDSLPDLSISSGTVNLSFNVFSGEIPASYARFPVKVSLDLRHNNLTGEIPQTGSLLNQGPTAFSGNPNLCGFPLQNRCAADSKSPNILSSPENPISVPNPKLPNGDENEDGEPRTRSGAVAAVMTISIVSGVSILIAAVSVSVWVFNKKLGRRSHEGKTGKEDFNKEELEEVVSVDEGQSGRFVALDSGFRLELEDLLRASAYVVGKSKGGIVYKVVCGGGAVVAVRRLSESGDQTWKFKEFVTEVEAIGKVVQHPNLVRLRAYYYASDEKLLVSDFIGNGSLHSALHGGASSSLPPLSWASRLKIAQGIARGLMHIHEYSPRRYVHGSIKSSKILLGDDLQPYVSGFGLYRLISGTSNKLSNPTLKPQNLSHNILIKSLKLSGASAVYSAPELRCSSSKFTQKCDVYSFGVVLLEILTGKLLDAAPENDEEELESFVRKVFREKRPMSDVLDPSLLHEVYAKKQVIAAFHVALNCTELDPEVRPRMRYVSESLDRINLQ